MWEVIYYLNLTLYTVLLLSISFVAVVIAVVCSLTGRRLNTNYYVARTFYHVAGPILGWKFKVEGEQYLWELSGEHGGGKAGEKGRSMVMVGNHQSFVDILYLGRIFPKHAAIMAKKSLQWIPGLGWFTGVPIVPVVCENYNHLFNGKSHFRRGTLRIKVLPPISTAGLSTADVPKLIEKTRNAMLQTLQEISTPSPATSQTGSPDPLLGRSGRGREEYYTSGSPVPPEGVSSTAEIGAEEEAEAAVEDAVGREEADNGERHAPVFSQNDRGDETMTTAENVQKSSPKRLAIAMVSDFFFPIIGGVEGHIYSLSVELMRRGHKVIVITHSHPDRSGVHYLAPSLKVYYLPYLPITSSASLPNFLLFLPYFRHIILSENIQLIHGHGALSSLAHEAVLHAPLLGVKAVFTDHSLFGFGDAVGVLTNKLLGAALRCVDEVICVSNTGRENTVLRAQLDPSIVSVIPNALEAEHFKPDPSRADPDWITIVVISRLVHRKGIDLLISSAPQICALFPKVRFIVGGDGPKMVELEQMREKYELQGRVELLGRVNPGDVRDVLTKGQIYLSNSLTEAFGISIIEAASAGLFVVATKVGGVPEILPQDMIEFCRADEDDVIRALTHAIHTIQSLRHSPWSAHIRVRDMYSWSCVASRAEIVYLRAMSRPHRETGERMKRYLELGPVFGVVMCCILAVEHYFFWLLEWWNPRDKIQQVVKFQGVERFEDGGKKEEIQVRKEQ
ncbi:phosphatidylinositol glycan class A [Cryptococcus deuterogattii R265]|uniref:phosphatidylinositol glycan class A n=1 Tax=Cryptococcus deuterogattii (strain R265) TaxID=294750 RepID=UPI0019354E77|nr:phosphatidylinositol glycan class A [Cryptococcus deuterogattii R265]